MKHQYLTAVKQLPYFENSTLWALFPTQSRTNLNQYLSYWVKTGAIHRLTRGFYVTDHALTKYQSHPHYRPFIAAILCYPSYLSGEYILSKHQMLTEGVTTMTSVTLTEKKQISNVLGNFAYRQINPALFTGYTTHHFLEHEYWEASKCKALFDYFYYYLRTLPNTMINSNVFEELRLNLDYLNEADIEEFGSYVKLSGNKKLLKVQQLLTNYASYHPSA